MKKIIINLSIFACIFLLSGCSSNNSLEQVKTTAPNEYNIQISDDEVLTITNQVTQAPYSVSKKENMDENKESVNFYVDDNGIPGTGFNVSLDGKTNIAKILKYEYSSTIDGDTIETEYEFKITDKQYSRILEILEDSKNSEDDLLNTTKLICLANAFDSLTYEDEIGFNKYLNEYYFEKVNSAREYLEDKTKEEKRYRQKKEEYEPNLYIDECGTDARIYDDANNIGYIIDTNFDNTIITITKQNFNNKSLDEIEETQYIATKEELNHIQKFLKINFDMYKNNEILREDLVEIVNLIEGMYNEESNTIICAEGETNWNTIYRQKDFNNDGIVTLKEDCYQIIQTFTNNGD